MPIIGINYKDDDAKAQKWLQDLKDPYVLNISDPKGSLGMELGVQIWRERLAPVYQELNRQ